MAAGLAVVGGLLLALSLPPWPVSTGAWPLALVGAACLFAAADGRRWFGRLGVGLAAGFAFYLPALWWIREFSVPGLIAVVALEALILALALTLVPASGLVRIVAFPSALVVAEAVRGAFPFGGLPLAGIDLGQAGGPLAPAARLGGRLLIVGVVGLAGAGLATLVVGAIRAPRGSRVPPVVGGLAGIGLAVVLAAAGWVAPAGQESGRLETAAVQGGGLRGLRAVDSDPGRVFDAQLRASAVIRNGMGLVLWPEDVVDVDGALAGSVQEEALSSLAQKLQTTLVAGIVEDVGTDRFLNAAVAWGPDGNIVARYDKVHRVPFGEYVPARGFFDGLADLSDVPRDAIPGRGAGVLNTGGASSASSSPTRSSSRTGRGPRRGPTPLCCWCPPTPPRTGTPRCRPRRSPPPASAPSRPGGGWCRPRPPATRRSSTTTASSCRARPSGRRRWWRASSNCGRGTRRGR